MSCQTAKASLLPAYLIGRATITPQSIADRLQMSLESQLNKARSTDSELVDHPENPPTTPVSPPGPTHPLGDFGPLRFPALYENPRLAFSNEAIATYDHKFTQIYLRYWFSRISV